MRITIQKENKVVPEKSSAFDVAKILNLVEAPLAVKINGQLTDLSQNLKEGDQIEFITFSSKLGKEIFWHTSAHLLALAIKRLWPEAIPTIGPAIENGFYYDFANLTISDTDFEKIEKEVHNILKEDLVPKKMNFKDQKEALKNFKNNPYKKEIIEESKEKDFTAYQIGEFFDLCRGPHLPRINLIQSFKILKTSGAYWRGDSNREMLTRLYAISFPTEELLKEYLFMLEEAQKRDHKKLGAQLELYSFHDEAPGIPFIHPKGMFIWESLLSFNRECLAEAKYQEIKTPLLLNKELWIRSGHWVHYRNNMYTLSDPENREFGIKPMNCPGCMIYFKTHTHSYREFPLRIAEIGQVHRYEFSGALHGLFRVRSFHQDDAHIFLERSQIKDEIINVLSLADKIYMTFGLSYHLELSTRPEKSKTIGSDEDWEVATKGLQSALDEWGKPYRINEGEGAFYGPKIDIHIRDAIGRYWQLGTIQLDLSLPERFDLSYVDQESKHQRPIMIHRALYGSLERFLGILVENFAGKFPLWISPRGVRFIPIADRHVEYAEKLNNQLKELGISSDIDSSHESVSKKIRNAQIFQINYMLTIGDKELSNGTVNLRTRDNYVHGEISFDVFLKKVLKEKESRALLSEFA